MANSTPLRNPQNCSWFSSKIRNTYRPALPNSAIDASKSLENSPAQLLSVSVSALQARRKAGTGYPAIGLSPGGRTNHAVRFQEEKSGQEKEGNGTRSRQVLSRCPSLSLHSSLIGCFFFFFLKVSQLSSSSMSVRFSIWVSGFLEISWLFNLHSLFM